MDFDCDEKKEREARRWWDIASLLEPRFDELSLFLMSMTFWMLFILDDGFRCSLTGVISSFGLHIIMYLLTAFFFIGTVLSIYHIFIRRKKKYLEKFLMLFFAAVITGGSGVLAALYVLNSRDFWPGIFFIWNLINADILLSMLKSERTIRRGVTDTETTAVQVIGGLAGLAVVFSMCEYMKDFNWAVTCSICIAYATNINSVVNWLTRSTKMRKGK